MKIKILQPNVNESFTSFRVKYTNHETKEGEIIYGLSAIKNVGEKATENIINEREANGEYKSFMDFLIRVDLRLVNKKTVEFLIFSGAFDTLEKNRRKLYLNIERAVMFASKIKETPENQGQHGLFSDTPSHNGVTELKLEDYEEFTEIEKYNNEKLSAGYYLTGHPLEKYRRQIENFVNLSFGDDINEIDFAKIGTANMCGVINDLSVKLSKKGTKFAVFNLVDFYGRGECIAFSKLYEAKYSLFENNKLVFVQGRAEESGDQLKLTLDNIYSIEHFQETLGSNITLIIDTEKTGKDTLESVKELAEKYPGTCGLYFTVLENGNVKHYKSKANKVSITSDLISNLKNIIGEDNLRIN